MGLFDIFDPSGGIDAANTAFNAQEEGFNKGFTGAKKYVNQGVQGGTKALRQGQQQGIGALNQGLEAGTGYLNQALSPYADLYSRAQQGFDAYGNAFGLGGQEGYDQARESFQTSPGYEFQQQQGLDAINRTANARGMLASGNNSQDLLDYSQGLANQEWGNYTAGLRPYLDLAPNLAGGQANLYGQLANLESNTAGNKANIYGQTGTNIANLKSNAGNTLGNYSWLQNTGIGQAGADQAMNQYQAEQAASQNLWNSIMGVAQAAPKTVGMFA